MHTIQKQHTMTEFDKFEESVKPTTPAFTLFEPERFHMVPRSKSTIHEFPQHTFTIGEPLRVRANAGTNPEDLIQMASDALLLAEHLRERQSAVQAETEAEKDAQALDKEAQTLFESIGCVDWHYTTGTDKAEYLTMARKAREIHGVSK